MVIRNTLTLATITALAIAACSSPAAEDPAGPPTIDDPTPTGSKLDSDACAGAGECRTGVCTGGICQRSTNTDGVKNGDESDVDCGGAAGPACGIGKTCMANDGCESKVCDPGTKRCKAPSFDDGVLNGTETDVDCGGPAPGKRCAAGKACKDHGDCESDGCAYDKKCAMGASCTQLEGGHTCGPNEGTNKQHDCCERAKVGAVAIDKYLVTAGRMRAFLARVNGKVRDFAAALPAAKWDQARTARLPNSMDGASGDGDSANTQLGPYFGKRSCGTDNYNGHTFWTPPQYSEPGDPKQDFAREVLDTKAINCVPWWLLSALCAFDGGHLVKEAELRAAYTNGGTTTHPWGARGAYTTNAANDFAVQFYGYATPNPPADARTNGDEFLDMAYYVAPPGRRPMGYNKTGHADLVGNLLEWVGDSDRQFVWKGSFERHSDELDRRIAPPVDGDPYSARDPRAGRNNRVWRWTDIVEKAPDAYNVNGYYAIGGRCAY